MADYGIAVKELDGLDLGASKAEHLAGGQDWFFVDDQPVVIFGDPVTPHAPPLPIQHLSPVMDVEKSTWMFLDDIGVIRQGHKGNCLHLSTGRPWFTIPD